jgi:hypothetical protein
MRKGISVLAGAGALAVLYGSTVTAAAQSPGTATISQVCVRAGGTQTVTVGEAAGTFVDIVVAGGAGSESGVTNAQGVLVDTFTVATGASGTVGVSLAAFTSEGLALGSSSFNVVSGQASPCPTTSDNTRTFNVELIDETQASVAVKKSCAAGVSGSATFATTAVTEGTIAGPAVSIACGATVDLPKLPITGFAWRLHESTPPANGVAAADVTIQVRANTPLTTINNNAVSVATPAPTTRTLAKTGGGSGNPMLPWPVVLLGAILVAAGGGLLRRRRAS